MVDDNKSSKGSNNLDDVVKGGQIQTALVYQPPTATNSRYQSNINNNQLDNNPQANEDGDLNRGINHLQIDTGVASTWIHGSYS